MIVDKPIRVQTYDVIDKDLGLYNMNGIKESCKHEARIQYQE